MKISTDSWHYRLIDWCDFDHPNNLCAYFWKTMFAVIGTPIFFLAVALIVVVGGAMALLPFWWTFIESPFPLVVLVGLAEIIGLMWLLGQLIQDRREEEIYSGERERPTPSLFAEWIRAKHRKICPLLKFG